MNEKWSNKQKIIDYIFFAKIISSYGVVVLHLNHFWRFSQKKEKKWIFENIYETTFYYSVPFFVLCIGATLLDFNERYGLLEYNKKRIIIYVLLIFYIYYYDVLLIINHFFKLNQLADLIYSIYIIIL